MSEISNKIANIGWHYPGPGGISPSNIETLEELFLKVTNPEITIADVGCWSGMSSIAFGLMIRKYGGKKVYAIDWFKGSPQTGLEPVAKEINVEEVLKANLRYFNLNDIIEVIPLQSAIAVNNFNNESLDLVFIDADHRYLQIKQDINSWLPKVKVGGILCGHDCEFIIADEKNRNIFADTPKNPWNEVDSLTCHLGVCRAVTDIFGTKANIIGGNIWWIQKN